jgi:hypothetical protein
MKWLNDRKDFGWIIFWLLFILIWGVESPPTLELFGPAWWMDETGHAVFGFFGAMALHHFYRKYSPQGEFHSHNPREQKYVREFVISRILYLGVGWEILEAVWDRLLQPDWFNWLTQAQKGSLDTTIDIAINLIFAWLAMRIYYFYYFNLRKQHLSHDEAITSEIIRINADIERVNKEIHILHRDRRKKLRPAIKSFFRTTKSFLKSWRESKKNKS